MVRLKAHNSNELNELLAYFNSTMVRLKENGRIFIPKFKGFQFHYGTIKSPDDAPLSGRASAFQFHYGTIKSSPPPLIRVRVAISIPLWYD